MKRSHPIAIFALLVALFVAVLGPPTLDARADETPGSIVIIEQSTESYFRQQFVFRVRARSSAGNIIRARVVWQARASEANLARRVTDFAPAPEVELAYTWVTRFETTPPWQMVYYRWEFTDDAGNVYLSPRTRAEISDDTRAWQKLSGDNVSVYWYNQSPEFGRELLEVAELGYAHVAAATGYTPEDEIRVVMFNDQTAFCSIFSPRTCQEWFAGVSIGSVTVQWLGDDRRYVMYQVVPHELAHAFLNDWMGGRVNALPRWFNEGQAMNNELEGLDIELARARLLARMSQLTRLPLLDQERIEGRDSSPRIARWYAQSASLVAFLYERWGADSLGKIVEKVREGKRFEVALADHTGLSLEAFEAAWREWLGDPNPLPTLVPTPTFVPFPPTPTHEPVPRS